MVKTGVVSCHNADFGLREFDVQQADSYQTNIYIL